MPENLYPCLEIVSRLPGRIRCRFPRRFETSIDPSALKKRILSLTGITKVRINALARSIIINFHTGKVTVDHLEEYLQEVFQELSAKVNDAPANKISPTATDEESAPVSIGEEIVDSPIAGEIAPILIEAEVIVTEEIDRMPLLIPSLRSIEPLQSLCREQAEMIENLEEQRQELALTARIGQHYLRKGYRYSPRSSEPDIDTYFFAVSKERLEQVTDWTALARQQTEMILVLREQIADLQTLAAIGSAKLNKWRR
jgi:hypothetical protein